MNTKLLIVEDEKAILDALQIYFASQGFEVDVASETEQAQARIAAERYDVVLADLRLSGSFGTEGLDIVTFVRERSPETKVILLTAYGSPEIEIEALRRGAHAFLHKPQALSAIYGVIVSLLRRP